MEKTVNIKACIAANKRKSVFLVALLALGLCGLAFACSASLAPEDGEVFLLFSLIFIVGYLLFGYFKGSAAVTALSGAKEADPKEYRQLYNIVEELTIAAGLPMPKVYVMEEEAPNAFASGRNPENSAVTVTKGLLQKLNREELEGVLAHELSHIQNYDILFTTLVCVLVGLFALLGRFFWRFLFFGGRRRSSGKNNGQAIFLLIAVVLLLLSPLLSALVQMAVSREREYLADASGANLTKNPEGLARALEKIALDPNYVKGASPATSALYISNPLKSKELFSTHPPTELRIARLRAMR